MTFYQNSKPTDSTKHFSIHMNGSTPLRNGVKQQQPRHSIISNLSSRDELFADDLLYTREESFCTYTPLKILVTTFNGL
ncbi:unnamed protein product [Meloidogyne enterolobii]|uniref:Uncharacterized protein n=1 Tax=Meloidogyne enterolobii TaxID=390850 RepID=A0ACB1AHG8_MELEN